MAPSHHIRQRSLHRASPEKTGLTTALAGGVATKWRGERHPTPIRTTTGASVGRHPVHDAYLAPALCHHDPTISSACATSEALSMLLLKHCGQLAHSLRLVKYRTNACRRPQAVLGVPLTSQCTYLPPRTILRCCGDHQGRILDRREDRNRIRVP